MYFSLLVQGRRTLKTSLPPDQGGRPIVSFPRREEDIKTFLPRWEGRQKNPQVRVQWVPSLSSVPPPKTCEHTFTCGPSAHTWIYIPNSSRVKPRSPISRLRREIGTFEGMRLLPEIGSFFRFFPSPLVGRVEILQNPTRTTLPDVFTHVPL